MKDISHIDLNFRIRKISVTLNSMKSSTKHKTSFSKHFWDLKILKINGATSILIKKIVNFKHKLTPTIRIDVADVQYFFNPKIVFKSYFPTL